MTRENFSKKMEEIERRYMNIKAYDEHSIVGKMKYRKFYKWAFKGTDEFDRFQVMEKLVKLYKKDLVKRDDFIDKKILA